MPVTVSWNGDRTRAALVLSHPTGNIITAEMVAQARAILDDAQDVASLRLLTLEGHGADFSFGASVPEHAPDVIGRVLPEMHALVLDLLRAPTPTAAVVRGRCLGGGFELALACDFIIAGESATFGLPEIALGVFPPAGLVLLPHRVGMARAASAVLTGEPQSAAWWYARALVETVVPDAALAGWVDDWFARAFRPRSAASLRHAVGALRAALLRDVARDLPRVEALYLEELMRSDDAVEGIQAFLDKRSPRWKDE